MAYLRKLPSGKWQATYRDARGRRHSITRPTKTQARDDVAELESQVRRGAWIDPALARQSLQAWHDVWWAGRVIETATRAKQGSILRNHVLPEWGPAPLDGIRRPDVQAWIKEMTARGVGAQTVHNAVGLLRAMLDVAVKDEILARNPVRDLELPTIAKEPDRYIDDDELDAIIHAVLHPKRKIRLTKRLEQDAAMIRLAHRTGMRWGENAGLHTHRVNLGRGLLHVVEVVERGGNIKAYPKSDAGFRDLPLTDEDVELVGPFVIGRPSRSLVFPGHDGGPLSYDNWRKRVWDNAVKDAGLVEPLPTFNDLRHTAATNLAATGISTDDFQRWMGHEDYRTSKKYIVRTPQAVDRMRGHLAARDARMTHAPQLTVVQD